ncbi:hypothetical protein TYRP_003037 [Tyrophagus putrescentiae]|nr:hypothetical protein TYRP_003037 [Tyrophagus putrescentiae]
MKVTDTISYINIPSSSVNSPVDESNGIGDKYLLQKLLPVLEHTLLQFLYRAYLPGLLSGQVPLGN